MKSTFAKSVCAVAIFVLPLFARAEAPAMKAPRATEPFPLTDVRLLDGPFRDAMLRDQKYLLSLDPDRLLHTFRLNVKLAVQRQTVTAAGSRQPANCAVTASAIISPRCR